MESINGITRFEYFLDSWEQLLIQAANEKNPALWLYTNNARTALFMLEGLAKMYAGIHNKKRFEKIKARFKALEDTLGAVDYYDNFAKEFAANSNIPASVTDYMHAQTREKLQRLNETLAEDNWLGDRPVRIRKMKKRLDSADWKEPKAELKAIFDFYKRSIQEIKDFMLATGNRFTEIESQVHAMRRKLRWLSIYPQALLGVIQLKDSGVINENLTKYLTPEIINSKFNVMPSPGNNSYFLLFEKNYFLALSWIIAELGNLKDRGLKIMAISEAWQQITGCNHETAMEKACELTGEDQDVMTHILEEASTLCNRFLEEKNLDRLITGITSTKTKTV